MLIVPMGLNCFPANKRLAEYEVRAVLRHGRRVSDADFELKFMFQTEALGIRGGRLAIAVPKRKLKRAVARNRIKRLVRESFRRHRISIAPQDLLVTYRGTHAARRRTERSQLRTQLEALFAGVLRKTDPRLAEGPSA